MGDEESNNTPETTASGKQRFGHQVVPYFHGAANVPKSQQLNPTNQRKSTRYTWWSFLPIAAMLQFTKVVNIFYLITAALQSIPSIQTNKPIVVLVPTCFVICLGILKELIAEVKRWQEDRHVNNVPVTNLVNSGDQRYAGSKELQFEQSKLANVRVGDIVRVRDGEEFPADCVLLKIENDKGECFVKTVALDGERNLKPKVQCKAVASNIDSLLDPSRDYKKPVLHVECITPIKDLYSFEGRFVLQDGEADEKANHAIDLNSFMHRGCFLENSESVLALVIHTGKDSKLIMNLGKYIFKQSQFERVLNYILVGNLLLALICATINVVFFVAWTDSNQDSASYIFDMSDETPNMWLKNLFSVYLIVNSFVPLDLLVALELSKLFYTGYMENDVQMTIPDYVARDTVGFQAHSLSLHEELALVEYIFCDKTGTLTQNELVFRALSLQQGQKIFFTDEDKEGLNIQDLSGELDKQGISSEEMDVVTDFFRCISLCHDCISVNDEKASLNLAYNGPSVDEVCLLNMTKDTQKGYFLDRDSSSIRIMINGEEESYDLLKTFQFTSDRKAMSVVVRHPTEEGKAICFVKGADSSIFPLLQGYTAQANDKDGDVFGGSINAEADGAAAYIKKVDKNVEAFASKGLRTLLFAMKVIEIDEEGLENLEIPDVESELTLLAATAVEDLLQENVKECIVDFRAAGINVWMLTGDKGLTAKEIGVSCGLIPSNVGSANNDEQFMTKNDQEIKEDLQDNSKPSQTGINVASDQNAEDVMLADKMLSSGDHIFEFSDDDIEATSLYEKIQKFERESRNFKKYYLLISGVTIQVALDNIFMHADVAKLLLKAQSVVVYRSSPGQKAEVVKFMKRNIGGAITLAIGDGANDVNMIQQAHVGFGLMGKEGNQAASFADYAIPRFKDLRRALFWHGRPYGVRLVNLVTFCLFKSMIRATALYAIQWENGYSGHQPVEGLMHALFNILLTVWFQLEQSIFDQDVSRVKYGEVEKEADMPYTMSALFAYSRSLCNRKRFFITIGCFDLYSLVVGAIIFYVFFYSQGIMDDDGHIYGVFTYGVTATISVVWIHHIQLFMNTRNWTIWLVFWFCLSLAYLPLVCYLGQLSTKIDLTGAIYGELLPSFHLTAIIIVTVAICTLPLYLFKTVHQLVYWPQFYERD